MLEKSQRPLVAKNLKVFFVSWLFISNLKLEKSKYSTVSFCSSINGCHFSVNSSFVTDSSNNSKNFLLTGFISDLFSNASS